MAVENRSGNMIKRKICTKCKIEKSISSFYKRTYKNSKSHQSWCKVCLRNHRSAHAKEWYRKRRKHNLRLSKQSLFRRKYGITLERYEQMIVEQDNKCKICKMTFATKSHAHLDHDHVRKIARGVLCLFCNKGLGLFKDDQDTLQEAIRYLTDFENKVKSGDYCKPNFDCPPLSAEGRKNISKSVKNYYKNGGKHGFKGKHHTPENVEKCRKAHLGKKGVWYHRPDIDCNELRTAYLGGESLRSLARRFGTSHGLIAYRLKFLNVPINSARRV